MSPQEAAQQPHPDFAGLTLGEVRNLSTDAAARKEQELATTGQLQSLNATTNIEYGALNILRRDGTGLIKYVAGKANLLDILEERFEIDIKQRTRGNQQLADQLAQTLLHIQSHLPGNIRLLDPAKKGRYTQSDFVEAYSKIAIGNFLLNQQNLPINPAGHRLVQNIARAVDTTRMFQTIGNAWLTYANSPEGKAHLEESGHSIADIMREAGFTFSNQIAQARATADQRTEVLQASNWQPAIEDELDALLADIEAEEQLSELNQQEAAQPTTIPAEESITGQEIVIEPEPRSFGEASLGVERPETGSDEAGTSPDDTPESHLLSLIASGKAKTQDFARFFRDNPSITEAQATELGIRPLTQRGTPTATYTQGRLIAAKLTPQQFEDYLNGKLKGKALKQALSKPGTSVPTNFSIKAAGIAERFNIIKNASPIIADTPSAFQPDIKAAIKSVREAYRKLQNNPVTMKDGKVVQFSGNGFHELKNHAADRRVIAVVPQLKELCETAEFMYSAPNSEANKTNKADIAQYHYYLNKASFAGHANDAYILIAIAERTNGEFFYDLDATDIEEIDNIKSATDTLTATRVPNTGQQGGAPKSRLHNLKEFVNNYEQNLPIIAEQAESANLFTDGVLEAENAIVTKPTANFSIIGPRAKTWDNYKDRIFLGLYDGMPRVEIDDSKSRLSLSSLFNNASDQDKEAIEQVIARAKENKYIPRLLRDYSKEQLASDSAKNYTLSRTRLLNSRILRNRSFLDKLTNPNARAKRLKYITDMRSRYKAIREKRRQSVTKAHQELSELLLAHGFDAESLQNLTSLKKDRIIDFLCKGGSIVEAYAIYVRDSFISSNKALSEIFDHTELYDAYPELKNIKISFFQGSSGFADAAFDGKKIIINAALLDKPEYLHETILHEIQHWIQVKEGFAEGGSPDAVRSYVEKLPDSPLKTELLALDDFELYNRIAGEAEARNTARRRTLTPEERAASPFNTTLDVEADHALTIFTDPTATFSIKPAAADTLDRFTADPLGERIIHHIRTEARRYARLLGDNTPYEQAVNAAQSAASIITAVDKYLHTPGKPVPARYRRQLQKLRSIAEKYAQIIASGTPRSFKKISPQEKQELETAIAELEAQELETATTESDQLLTDSDRLTKREAAARAREHHRAIVRSAAKGRVYQTLSSMLEVAADALDSYLKHQLLQKLDRLTATVKIKRSPSKRLQGKMTAPAYRELERAINLMALSDRAYQDEIENVITAHETLARAISQGNTNLTSGNALLIQLADQLTTSGQQVPPQTLTAALANHEAALKIYGNVSSKTYEQTRLMANALFYLIRNGRNQWKAKHEAREAFIQQYLQHFLAHTPATSGTEQTARLAKEKEQKGTGFTRFANSMMNSIQLFHALSGIEALAPLMEYTKQKLATAGVARDLHMKQMVEQVQAAYGRIIGIKPATSAGYSQRQLKEISAKLDKFYEQNNQVEQTNITRHYLDADGNHQTEQLKLTKWQALDLILTYRQQHYRPNAQEHGYTDELLAQLENWCGEDLLTLGNAMQQSIPNDGTIPVYEEREGIPLRDNPLYWPAHLNIAEQETPDHPAISNPYHAAGSYRFLKGRTSNLREVAARNAYNVWKSAIAERANYVYLAPITDTLNSLLARKEFAARLKTLIGPTLYEQLKLTLNEIDGTTWAETSLQEDPHGAIARTLRNMAPALLAGNPTTLIKQSSAIANATLMPDFPPHEFAKQLIKLQQNQSGITIGQILRLDAFKARVRDNSALNDMLALGTDAKYSTYANLARSWMGLIDATDTFFNAIGATLYYNHKYEQYTKENQENGSPLTQAEIHAKCETDIAVMLALTAQPLKRTDKSAFFWRNSKTLLGPLYLYMGSEMINKVGMARANWLKRKAQGMGAAKNTLHWMYQLGAGIGGVAFLTSIACAILTGNTPDDDDSLSAWLIATYLHSAFGQYTSQMPVIGQIVDLALSPYAQFIDGVADFPGVKTATAAKKLGTMITDDKTYSGAEWQTQINRLARDLNGITGYWGGVNSQTRWLTVTSSILQTFTAASNWINPIAKGATHDAFFADWLPDWYTQTDTRSPRRPKSLIEQWLTPATEESPRRRRSTARRRTARRTTPRKRKQQEE